MTFNWHSWIIYILLILGMASGNQLFHIPVVAYMWLTIFMCILAIHRQRMFIYELTLTPIGCPKKEFTTPPWYTNIVRWVGSGVLSYLSYQEGYQITGAIFFVMIFILHDIETPQFRNSVNKLVKQYSKD